MGALTQTKNREGGKEGREKTEMQETFPQYRRQNPFYFFKKSFFFPPFWKEQKNGSTKGKKLKKKEIKTRDSRHRVVVPSPPLLLLLASRVWLPLLVPVGKALFAFGMDNQPLKSFALGPKVEIYFSSELFFFFFLSSLKFLLHSSFFLWVSSPCRPSSATKGGTRSHCFQFPLLLAKRQRERCERNQGTGRKKWNDN